MTTLASPRMPTDVATQQQVSWIAHAIYRHSKAAFTERRQVTARLDQWQRRIYRQDGCQNAS